MKISIASDVHLEFGPLELENKDGADVLILSGDICVATDLRTPDPYGISKIEHYERFHQLMQSCNANFAHTIYVMGNHEHYHGDFAQSANTIRAHLKEYPNIHFLDKESIIIDGVLFYGGTMWTNFDQGYGPGDEMAMRHIAGMMNDYRGVKNTASMVTYNVPVYKTSEDGKYVLNDKGEMILLRNEKHQRPASFAPRDSFNDHNAFIEQLHGAMKATDLPIVVVSHHAPSKQSTHPRYADETMINTAYSSDLTHLILNHPRIKLWTHGHTHEDFDYMVGSTRIVCNPRGYHNYEQRADYWTLKTVEI